MKKVLTLLLAILLAASTNLVIASSSLPLDNVSEGTKVDNGKLRMQHGDYVLFKGLDLTNVKSVRITAKANWSSFWDGDIFEVRVDSPKGEIIGYIDLDSEERGEFGCNINKTGEHDVYLISTYGPIGASTVDSVYLSEEALPEKESYVPVPDDVMTDDYSDTWAGVSGLGRKVADYSETGGVKEGKEVGLFYWNWNVNQESTVAVINNTTFQREHPEAYREDGYLDPAWPVGNTICFWGEPLYGYYTGNDYWVYRKDAELLSEAGVDFLYLDYTNGSGVFRRNLNVMLEAFRDAKKTGVDVPKFTFTGNMVAPVKTAKYMVEYLYLTLYKKGLYSDLWYYRDGKPLFIVDPLSLEHYMDKEDAEDKALYDEIMRFFTFRHIDGDWAKTKKTHANDAWAITDKYPQIAFGEDSKGRAEAVTVCAAINKSIETDELVPMSYDTVRNKNYTETLGHIWGTDSNKYNYYFEEQVSGALKTDGTIMLISSYNEWTAVRNENYIGKFKNSFIDHFDQVGTRDLAISRDDNKDHGFMLMVDAIRKWKGVRPAPVASAEKTIDMGDISSWNDVAPEYKNVRGVYNRDIDGYAGSHYENKTARNNIRISKVARDGENIWFYAQCEKAITAPSGNNWMALYIDKDRNHATGWEGYDFKVADNKIYSFNGAWNENGTTESVLSGNTLQIKIPKRLISLDNIDIEFKWADNSDDSDILNFYINGIAAPAGRFNYVYSVFEQKAVTDADRALLKNTTVVKPGSNKAVINGGIMNAFEANTAYGVREINSAAYVPYSMLKDVIGYGTTIVTYEKGRNFFKIDSANGMCYATVNSLEGTTDGKKITLNKPVVDIDGIAYVPLTFLSDMYGFDIVNLGNGCYAVGTKIDIDASLRASELL